MRRAHLEELDLEPRVRRALAEFFRRLDEGTWRRIQRVILYGSVARGEAGPGSDVDLLIVWEGARVEAMERVGRPATQIFIDTGIDIAVQYILPNDFTEIERIRTTFYQNLDREGILVAGGG